MSVEVWVHCDQHGRPHRLYDDLKSCWCGCIDDLPNPGRHATVLGALNEQEAFKECRERDLWLYCDSEKKRAAAAKREKERAANESN